MPRDWRKIPWDLRYRFGAKLGSDLRRMSIALTHRHCRVEFQGPVRIGPGFALEIPDRGEFIVGPGVTFRRGFVCEISGTGRVVIGAATTFTSNALIQCSTSIEIGERNAFGQALQIADGSHKFRDPTIPPLEQGYNFRPIKIGDHIMVHSKVTVVADIGDYAVIGANSLVTKDVPPYCLAGGVPARIIEFFGPEERRPVGIEIERG
jgi:acetyltransferase-like isoleucine patch superfamily enzyme